MRINRISVAVVALGAASLLASQTAAFGDTLPSGQRTLGGTTIEPAYDDMTGSLVYLSTPNGTQQGNQVHANAHNTADIYLPMYPTGSDVGALNCQHQPMENCPDHGQIVTDIAMHYPPVASVYANGVVGHDHLVGIASTGGDFNVTWEPVLVLFTPAGIAHGANQTHITTLAQIDAAVSAGYATELRLPPATFKCASVNVAAYNHGTAVTPVAPAP
jgi:hypothetical protein